MRRITVLYPYHPGGVGSNAIFLRRQPEAIGGAGAVSEAARGVRRELEHLHSASPLQIFCGVELGREIYCEVAKLVGRCKCRVSHRIIGSVSFTEYSYLSTWQLEGEEVGAGTEAELAGDLAGHQHRRNGLLAVPRDAGQLRGREVELHRLRRQQRCFLLRFGRRRRRDKEEEQSRSRSCPEQHVVAALLGQDQTATTS